jgi:hypothetical protein
MTAVIGLIEAKSILDTLPKYDLINALQKGPQTVIPPSLHRLPKAEIKAVIRRALAAGGDVSMGMAMALHRARLDRDIAIVCGSRRR